MFELKFRKHFNDIDSTDTMEDRTINSTCKLQTSI